MPVLATGASPQCDGIRRKPAHALRRRSEQPGQVRLDHEGDHAGQRWDAMAATGPCRGYLPGDRWFRCGWSAGQGARQLREVFEHVGLTRDVLFFRGITRLEQLKHLIGRRQIDAEFYWRALAVHEPEHHSK